MPEKRQHSKASTGGQPNSGGSGNLKVYWLSHNRKAKQPPNPDYPEGCDIDLSEGAPLTCSVDLPYPAPGCGVWTAICSACGLRMGVTAAGRPDDPRRLTLACKGGSAYDGDPKGRQGL